MVILIMNVIYVQLDRRNWSGACRIKYATSKSVLNWMFGRYRLGSWHVDVEAFMARQY